VAVIDDPNLAVEAKHSQLGELSEQLILRLDMLVARKSMLMMRRITKLRHIGVVGSPRSYELPDHLLLLFYWM
jgi:hypothetical protein